MKKRIAYLLLVLIVFALTACKSAETRSIKSEDIQMICELSTLKCYYNNVAEIIKEKNNIFQKDRKMWIEYEGEVVIGIDMAKVTVNVEGDVVTVTLPDAEIQDIKVKKDSLTSNSYVASEDSWLAENKITTEDQQEAVKKGQIEMESTVLGNESLFIQAKARAKDLIENYIAEIGKVTGHSYEITWVDIPSEPVTQEGE